MVGTLPGDRQTVPEPLPLQDCRSVADAVDAAAIATAAAPAANSGVMYFFRFLDIAALLKVSSCLLTRTTSPMTAVNPLRAAENPLSIPVTGCGRCAAKFERKVDPQGKLSPQERAKRAEYARRAQMQRMALKSAKARRSRKA